MSKKNQIENINQYSVFEKGSKSNYVFLNIFIAFLLPILCINFTENPKVIGVILFLILFVFLPLNTVEYFYVGEVDFFIIYKCVFFLQFLNKKRIFEYDNIKKITAKIKYDKKIDFFSFLANFFTTFTFLPFNNLEIEYRDGSRKYINTLVYKPKLITLLKFIELKSAIQVEIT